MARAVFQVLQDHTPTSEISSTKIKRGQDRSFPWQRKPHHSWHVYLTVNLKKDMVRQGILTQNLLSEQFSIKRKTRLIRLGCCSICCPDGQSNSQSLPIKSNKFWTGFYKLLSIHKPDFFSRWISANRRRKAYWHGDRIHGNAEVFRYDSGSRSEQLYTDIWPTTLCYWPASQMVNAWPFSVTRFTIGMIPYVVMLHLSCWQTLVFG